MDEMQNMFKHEKIDIFSFAVILLEHTTG